MALRRGQLYSQPAVGILNVPFELWHHLGGWQRCELSAAWWTDPITRQLKSFCIAAIPAGGS